MLDVLAGAQVLIYKNNELIGGVTGGPVPPTKYTIDKKYLLPVPNETITIRFVASAVGFMTKEKIFSLSELQKQTLAKKAISFEFKNN